MAERKINYPLIATGIAFFACIILGFTEYGRVSPELAKPYIYLRTFQVVSFLCLLIYFWKKEFSDLAGALCSINFVFYVWSMMWFLPLYECAYFQCAIGAAFFNFKRSWIHPLIFGVGGLGMIATYLIQDALHWQLPETGNMDWMFSVLFFFGVAWAIQNFAIRASQKENDRLLRFSIIGKETARLTHDLKGLLSSPLLILEAFRDKTLNLPADFHEKQMSLLIADMDKVRDSLTGINRLAIIKEHMEEVEVNRVLNGALKILERRLKSVSISLPAERWVWGSSDLLHSVFFNLVLNSIEAFERMQAKNPQIDIYWERDCLVMRDNAGGFNESIPVSNKSEGGLGLQLVRSDLRRMNAAFVIRAQGTHTLAKIHFASESMLVEKN